MAFKEEQVSDLNQLVTKLETFCKNNLKWHSASNAVFKPLENGDSFEIFEITENLKVNLDDVQKFTASKLSLKITGDTYKTRCDMILGLNRVWFSGDSSNVLVIIETEKNNFRWFGFGITKPLGEQTQGVAWCNAQCWYEDGSSYNQGAYSVRNLTFIEKISPFFGSSCAKYYGDYNNIANRIKYKNIFYSDVGDKNVFGGGWASVPYCKIMNTPDIALTNSRVLGKVPLYVLANQDSKLQIISEMPLWYAINIENIPVPSEMSFGGKNYMVFSVGSVFFDVGNTNNDIDTDKITPEKNNFQMMTKPRTGYAGFAVLME